MDKSEKVMTTKITESGMFNEYITKQDFLTAPNETAIVKYGYVLQSIMQIDALNTATCIC